MVWVAGKEERDMDPGDMGRLFVTIIGVVEGMLSRDKKAYINALPFLSSKAFDHTIVPCTPFCSLFVLKSFKHAFDYTNRYHMHAFLSSVDHATPL